MHHVLLCSLVLTDGVVVVLVVEDMCDMFCVVLFVPLEMKLHLSHLIPAKNVSK